VVNDTGVAAGSASGATGAAAAGSGAGSGGPAAGGLVNLNTADAAALDTLPGVGPVMAQNIIAWRSEHGKFSSVEQLQEISGIGPSRYAQISALVTVG
jgi:competence protein ComEA